MHAPDIQEIDVTGYTGQAGDAIRIRVTDDFKVAAVSVSVYNSDSTLIETGDCVQQSNVIDWVYTATAGDGDITGDKIVIEAMDKPGNVTSQETTL